METGGMFTGLSKVMFFMGLFVGIAVCTTAALIFMVWNVSSGKGLGALAGSNQQAAAAAAQPTQAAAAAQPSGTNTPTAGPVKPVDEKTDHILGPSSAKVTLIEYSDFECPYCKTHYQTLNQIMQQYSGKVRLVYRHYPLSFHQNAEKEAEASECAAELGGNDAFWKIYNKIFTETTSNGTGIALERLGPMAKEIGLNQAAFQKCLDSGKYATLVAQDEQDGSDAGVQGTPATFVNGKMLSGAQPLANIKAAIDAALK